MPKMRMVLNLVYGHQTVSRNVNSRCPRSSLPAVGFLAAVILMPALAQPARAQEGTTPVRRTVALMGTLATVQVWGRGAAPAHEAANAAIAEMERVEAVLSSWRADSEVGLFNSAVVGTPVSLSPELTGLLAEAGRWSAMTGGAFEPCVGSLVDAWDLRGSGRLPSDEEIARALRAVGAGGVRIEVPEGRATRLDDRAWLDLGAFGKGAALRNARDTLLAHGIDAARVDLGGQLLVVGPTAVSVGVAHPAHRQEVVARLEVSDRSVATSGQSERTLAVGGESVGHILDPRSGRPAPAWGSVTVVADDPLVADALATGLFVLGPSAGMALAETLVDVGVLFLEDRGRVLRASHNRALEAYVRRLPDTPSMGSHTDSESPQGVEGSR